MDVVQRERTADAIAVVEDDRAARVRESLELRVRNRAAVDRSRLSGDRANRVQVVDGVIEHFEPWRALQERPLFPRLPVNDAHLDIAQLANRLAIDQVPQCEHVRAEAQLKIHRGGEPSFAAQLENGACRRQIIAHRFLDQDRSARRKATKDRKDLVARHGDVEHRVGHRGGVGEGREDDRDRELRRRLARRVGSDVEEARDREPKASVRGQVRRADDRPGADHDDGPRSRRQRPCLPQVRHRARQGVPGSGARPLAFRLNTGSILAHHSPGGVSGAGSCSDRMRRSHSATRPFDAACDANAVR